jgi:uncharacterized protein YoxC
MTQDSLVLVLTVFVGLVAVSQVGQFIALLALQRRAKAMHELLVTHTPRIESVLQSAKETLEVSRKQITEVTTRAAEVTAKANDILDSTRTQVRIVEGIMTEVASRTKSQLDRVEIVLDDTIGRVHETVTTVHNGVMRPLREINGISVGIRAALAHMVKGGRPSVAQATQDEEMFIRSTFIATSSMASTMDRRASRKAWLC